MTTDIQRVESADEIARCYPVMAELRPHIPTEDFVELVQHMATEGYQLVCVEEDGNVVAVAGYRVRTTLFMGKNLYVDDLVTSEHCRSKGHGKMLIDWLRDEALKHGCKVLHLDSGTQRHRAHRFYLRQGLDIASFHFSQKIDTI